MSKNTGFSLLQRFDHYSQAIRQVLDVEGVQLDIKVGEHPHILLLG